MSSLPGLDLEDFLSWQYNLVVLDAPESNVSLGLAECLGLSNNHRPILTKAEFAPIVALFEPHRAEVEDRLMDFDEDNMSWRDYAGYSFDFLGADLDEAVFALLAALA